MLDRVFVNPDIAQEQSEAYAGKMGVKVPMPKPYNGSAQDLVVFENWLSQLLGWLQLNHMDVSDLHMD
jgi:hypothetical protein